MKKIFRLASVLALSGIALMYTGCTKDYDADIKAIETDLAELQSGTIADQSNQIAALQNQAAQLQTLANQYKQLLDGLEAKKADKTELASAISELQNSISGQIAQINTTIDGINEIIANKADKSWVEQTFATKNALAEVESDLGAVSGRVAAIEASLLGMGVDLGGIDTFIDQVNQTATQASQDAQSALGQVAEIQNSLAGYYTQGQVDELIDASIAQLEKELASKDSAISAQEKADKEMLLNRIKAVQKTLDPFMAVTNGRLNEAYDSLGSLEQLITALTAQVIGIDQAYKDADDAIYDYLSQISGTESSSRVSAIKSIRDSLKNAYTLITTNKTTLDGQISSIEANINKVNTALKNHSDSLLDQSRQILGLSNRIKSISVFPSKTGELYRYVMGNDSTLILTTTFQVRPAAALSAANLQNSTIRLFATNAKKRGETRSVSSYIEYPVTVLSADASRGLLEVKVRLLDDTPINDVFANKSELFFALQIEAQDTVGTYKVMSEYQNPVYGEVVNLKNNFFVDTNSNKSTFESDEIDYTLCKDTSFYAFNKGNSAIYVKYTTPNGVEVEPISEFEAYTGMTLTVSDTVIVKSAIVAADTCALITPNAKSGFATMVDFKDKDAIADYRPYVGEKDTVIYEPKINGVAAGISYKHAIEIIPVLRANVNKEFHIYWNYKNYALGNSTDTLKYDSSISITTEPATKGDSNWWSYAIKKGGYDYIGSSALSFSGYNGMAFSFNSYDAVGNKYDSYLTAGSAAFDPHAREFSDTLKKESTSDRLNFIVKVTIDSLPVVKPASFDAGTVKFAYTKDNTVKFNTASVAAKFIGTDGNIKPYLIKGLSSYNYNDIFAEFYKTSFKVDSVAKKNDAGAWETQSASNFSFADSTNIVVTAGALEQNKSYRVFASNVAFKDVDHGSQVLCKAVFEFKTDAALLKLAYEPLVVTSAVAKTQVDMTAANSDTIIKVLTKNPNNHFALAVAEGGVSSNLTLKNMYAKNYLRVDTVANDVSEDYSMFTVDYEISKITLSVLMPDYSLITKPATSKLSVDALQKRINLVSKADADDQFFSFETAEGRAYMVTATLKCNGVSNPVDTKNFILWTKAPLKLDVPAKYEGLTTLPGVNLNVDVASKIKVHNIVNGVYQTGSILGDATKEGYYKFNSATDMKYEFVSAKCNGVDQPMTVGVHYTLDATTGEFVLLKDNVQGTWEINIKVTMKSWLDYKHYDFKTSQAGLQYGTITLVVNKAN